MPERPSAIDPLERLKWDYWAKIDGMPKEEAQGKWLEAIKPIMERENYPWVHPNKAAIDKKYQQCVERQLKEGKTVAEIEAARKAYLAEEERLAEEEM